MSPPEHQQRLQGKHFTSYGHSASPLIPGAVGIRKEASFAVTVLPGFVWI